MWVTASTGTITDALYKVFPETLFMIVFVGHQREDYFNKKRMKVFISPQKFRQHPNILPPYRSEPSYDGKIWQFIKKNGKNNDYIFNNIIYASRSKNRNRNRSKTNDRHI